MHDLAVDAIKTVTDEKRVRCDPLLDLHRFDDGGAECGSGLWLDERLDFARCSASLPDFRWLSLGDRQFLQASHLKSITFRRR
jgi:hypothetical protein